MRSLVVYVVGSGLRAVDVKWVFNAGYAGCNSEEVRHHIEELAALGVPAPKTFPTLYPLGSHVVSQEHLYQAPHDKTSGEAEWALYIGNNENEHLLMAACDHTDRALEAHGVAWSKQSAPDFIGDLAWRYSEVKNSFSDFTLKAWVKDNQEEQLIQDGNAGLLISPSEWLKKLEEAGLARPGTLLMSGTIPMKKSVNQFSHHWRVELADHKGNISRVSYEIERLADAWE
ncbi:MULTISPECIES: DUF2848 family protein [Bartonella]|uniref:DUF2848 domain-containing protein n=1 Tax=Bartonella choladocola TaxID=2750995 RepID=A0A1U9MF46_9HYPH|nr:DUF2848 family protein [Bartonella choladocola]AQT46555.1 Protein of unknown function (DUF2848) [Bartonella choladocola]MBI0139919.1 DUF2848 family protein [Bartonella choladocola]